MSKTYIKGTVHRTARPRSERLRRLGQAAPGLSNTVVVNSTGSGKSDGASGDGHIHNNLLALNQISTDSEGYLYLNIPIEDDETGEIVYVDVKVRAGHSDLAYDLDPDSPVNNRFLSKLVDDIAAGHITFEQGLTSLAKAYFNAGMEAQGLALLKGGVQVGNYIQGLWSGTGAAIDLNGNAEVESLKVRSFLEVMELIINRLSAIEGDQLLTEADTIERVEDLGDGTYRLHLQTKWDGYFTAQAPDNVLKGILNTLTDGHGETSYGSGQYYTAWMRVLSVNAANNTIEVIPYPDDQVPSGKNYLPASMMKVARWGNATDTTRQSCLYLSTTEGRIVKLSHVTKPIIDQSNYGFVIGEMPDFIKNSGLPIQEGADYAYFRGIVVQDSLRMDYQGNPIVEYVDRGTWVANPTEPYHCNHVNGLTGVYETSDVWYLGCKWRCLIEGATETPRWNSTQWAMVEGNPDFTIDIESSRGDSFDFDSFGTVLTVTGRIHNQDVTSDIRDADVQWTRYSEDAQGNPRTSSDNVWAARRAGSGKTLPLTKEDIDFDGSELPKVLRFIATATLRDGMSAQVAYEYS